MSHPTSPLPHDHDHSHPSSLSPLCLIDVVRTRHAICSCTHHTHTLSLSLSLSLSLPETHHTHTSHTISRPLTLSPMNLLVCFCCRHLCVVCHLNVCADCSNRRLRLHPSYRVCSSCFKENEVSSHAVRCIPSRASSPGLSRRPSPLIVRFAAPAEPQHRPLACAHRAAPRCAWWPLVSVCAWLSLCPSVPLSPCLSVPLSLCLSVSLSLCPCICACLCACACVGSNDALSLSLSSISPPVPLCASVYAGPVPFTRAPRTPVVQAR